MLHSQSTLANRPSTAGAAALFFFLLLSQFSSCLGRNVANLRTPTGARRALGTPEILLHRRGGHGGGETQEKQSETKAKEKAKQAEELLCREESTIKIIICKEFWRSSALTHSQDHNYTAPLPASPPPPPPPRSSPPLKRSSVLGGSHWSPQCLEHSPNLASRQGTDKEEERRRKNKVKERQRHNELNNCFLRNHIPVLSNNNKASKIMILKGAKDTIRNLEAENKRKNQELGRLVERSCWLEARLDKLKGL
ncbi:hypothetical protein E1301_Tti021986 [Triplophysa tibetana]|uniref:BHLH domain-containing protein n=1 Tax=Triplophysa tibetana TaxID=1572043 RepID=A0A5A9PBT4_9TELE|nr:hypothetical protein E1301_Tti021986 [Triplophysa tibetana]